MFDLADKKAAVLIAPQDFRDEEFAQTHAALKGAKVDVTVVSTEVGKCEGMLGSIVHARMTLDEALTHNWDCVALIGGSGASVYIDDERAWQLVRKTAEAGNVLAAICMAPLILSHAGLLDGVKATVFDKPEYKQDLEEHGALPTASAVVEGQNNINGAPLITGDGPRSAFAFGLTVTNAMRTPVKEPWEK